MNALHIVNKSVFSANSLTSCLDHLVEGDALLLIEDGVYAAAGGFAGFCRLQGLAASNRLFVLACDMRVRGVDPHRLPPGTNLVDYCGFVDLVAEHSPTHSWF